MHPVPASRIQVLVDHPDPLLALGLAAALGQARGIDVLCPATDGRGPAADVVLTDYFGGLALPRRGRAHDRASRPRASWCWRRRNASRRCAPRWSAACMAT